MYRRAHVAFTSRETKCIALAPANGLSLCARRSHVVDDLEAAAGLFGALREVDRAKETCG